MDVIKAIILGIIEGITEFLPVSSTGHLILANEFISFPNQAFQNLFNVFIQLGAILAIVVLFWKKLVPIGPSFTQEDKQGTLRIYLRTLVGIIPSAIAFVFLDKHIEKLLDGQPFVIAGALIVYGVVIILIDRGNQKKARCNDVSRLPFSTVLIIGCAQCLAMVPGTSRSAATIIAALLLGCSRTAAAEFSFYLAIPTMAGASLVSLIKYSGALAGNLLPLAVGFITAFIVALLVVRSFMKLIARHTFRPFGVYRIALGIVVIIYFALVAGAAA